MRSASSRRSSIRSMSSPTPRAMSSGGARSLAPSVEGHGRDDDENAVLGQAAPVAERDVLDISDAEPVDERDARLDTVDDPRAVRCHLDDGAVLGDHNRIVGDTAVLRQLRVRREHAVLAMDRHHRARPHQRQQGAQLLRARVAGDVDGSDLLVEHLGAEAGKAVDRVVHAELVARHRLRRDDHRVATLDRDVRVVAVGDPRQRGHRLALAPGAEHQHAVRRQLHRLFRRHDRLLRKLDIPEVARDVHVLPHRAADDRDFAAVRDRDLGGLLDAVHVRRERRDDDPPGAKRDELAEGLADESLGAGHPRTLRVRRVAEQKVDAAAAELGERTDVGLQAVDRRVVELPVTRVQDTTCVRLDHDRHRVGDRVRHANELEPERAELHRAVAGPASVSVVVAARPCSSSFDFTRPNVSRVPTNSADLHLSQHVREPADVVLVRMREHDRADVARRGTRSRVTRGRLRSARRVGTRAPRPRRWSRRRPRTPSCSSRPRRGRRAG